MPGYGDTGAALVDHPGVDKVAFTGSTEVGKKIAAAASGNLKKVSLELDGKAANIIFEDADLDAAIAGAVLGGYFNEGQCCVNGSRLYVQRGVFDQVVEGVAAAARAIKVGDGFDPTSDMGPLVSQEQHEKVLGYINGAVQQGAVISAGSADRVGGRGFFVQPTLITSVTEDMAVQTDEIFGPVVTAIPFDTEQEVVAAANNTVYGLAAGVWSEDIGTAHRVGSKLRAGTVWLNTGTPTTSPSRGVASSSPAGVASSVRSVSTTTRSQDRHRRTSMTAAAELEAHRVVPVVVLDDAARADDLGAALVAGGLPVAEVTFRTPDAAAVLGRLAGRGDLLVGAGTVITPDQVDRARDAGARFVVSPGLSADVVHRCHEVGLPVLPGVSTATEIIRALDLGVGTVKFFPAEAAVGCGAEGAECAVLDDALHADRWSDGSPVPTYLALPSVLAVGGSWMVAPALIAAGQLGRGHQAVRGQHVRST